MNLPFFNKTTRSTPREYFFALEIDHHIIKSSVWSIVNNKPQVLSVGLNANWDDRSEESLIEACDHCLTDSTNRIDQSGKIQPEKVILGLSSDWVKEEKILPDKLRLLKSISTQLSLTIVGFVVTSEAVVDHLQHLDGVPPTAILIGIMPHQLDITLVRLGKSEGTQSVLRSSKIAQDVIEGLSRFPNLDMLPSRILLYDSSSDLEDIRQRLLAHPWQSPQTKLPFLHFPKVEVLPPDFSIQSISLSGGFEVAQATGLLHESVSQDSLPEISPAYSLVTEEISKDYSVQDLGFELETDVQSQPVQTLDSIPELEEVPIDSPSKTKSRIPLPHFKLPSFGKWQFPKFTSPVLYIGIFLGILVVFGSFFAAYWYLPKSTVVIRVKPETITHEFTLTTSPGITQLDIQKLEIPARLIEVTATEEKTTPTTGSKLIGDKATGEVTIINGTSQTKSFPQGTILSSPSGLRFLLSSEASVASASGSADPNSYQPGKVTVKVTSDQIGTDSNLSAGTQFKIGSFSSLDFIAKNDAAFSGGSSRQVQAVSKADISQLKASVTDTAKSQIATLLSEKITSNEIIVSQSTSNQVVSEEYSHKLDEMSDDIRLKLTLKATALSVSKSDLASVVSEQIKSQIPDGYSLSNEVDYHFELQSKDTLITSLGIQATASLFPVLNTEMIRSNLAGKYPQMAVDYLKSLPGVSKVDISFPIPLPKPILTLPHISGNITVTTVTSEN